MLKYQVSVWEPSGNSFVYYPETAMTVEQVEKAAWDTYPDSATITVRNPDGSVATRVDAPTTAGAILRTAADMVDGPREVEHGDKAASFEGIAAAWTTYLQNKWSALEGQWTPLSGYDVAQLMVLLKMTRPQYGTRNPDHGLDQCGYSGIAAMLAGEE